MKKHLILTMVLLVASICGMHARTVSTTVAFGQVAQYAEKSDYDAGEMANGSIRSLAIYSGGVNTTTNLKAADDQFNTTEGASKLSNTSQLGSKLNEEGSKKNHIRFSALKDDKVRLYYFSSSALGEVHTFYLSHTSTADASKEGNSACKAGDKKIYYVDFEIPEDGTYYISVNGGQNQALTAGTQISISAIRFEYKKTVEYLFDYTWTATAFSTDKNSQFDMTSYGTLRIGSAIRGVSGSTDTIAHTSKDKVHMVSLGKKDNYIELSTSEDLNAGDVIEILGYAGGESERGLYFEPTTKTTYNTNSTTALATSKSSERTLHYSYNVEVTKAWLENNNITNTIRIFCNGNTVAIEKIKITRPLERELTLNADGYTTFSWDKNYTVDGATAYSAKWEEGVTTFVTLNELSGVIPANEGIILAGNPGETVTVTATAEEATADMSENVLEGTVNTPVAALGKYLLARQNEQTAFYLYTDGDYMIPVRKAYLTAPSTNAPIRVDLNTTPGISTGIEQQTAIQATKILKDGCIYILKGNELRTLTGARVK